MIIKIYITTYNNDKMLLENLNSLRVSGVALLQPEVTVINNYGTVLPDSVYKDAKVVHNVLRLDSSTGHLSRNWNQALMNGFVDLNKPEADIVVCAQNDIEWKNGWLYHLIDWHETFDFITMGDGDAFHSYKPRHIKRVGLWDERFCNIACHEHDYLLRSSIYNKERSSINTLQKLNPIINLFLKDKPSGAARREPSHIASKEHHPVSDKVFQWKWGLSSKVIKWSKTLGPKRESFITYPYFEKNVETLKEQKYVH